MLWFSPAGVYTVCLLVFSCLFACLVATKTTTNAKRSYYRDFFLYKSQTLTQPSTFVNWVCKQRLLYTHMRVSIDLGVANEFRKYVKMLPTGAINSATVSLIVNKVKADWSVIFSVSKDC